MTRHLEIERKYDAADGFVLPDLSDMPGCVTVSEPETHLLVATYFDTSELALAARGITLRRRSGGTDAGWHLKIPVSRDAREELQAPLGEAETVPGRLADMVAASTRGEPLGPVAVLGTRRLVVRLLDAAGAVLAEVADDAVRGEAQDRDQGPVAWREIEVELGEAGSPDLLKAVGRRLRKAGARRSTASSKLSRVLTPDRPAHDATARDGTEPERQAAAAPAPGTAGEAAVAYLTTQVQAVLALDPKARLGKPDAVHRMRVAVRRTRSVLRSYGRVLDRTRTDPIQPELRWLASVLGEVRDLEVLRDRFAARLDELPEPESRHRRWLDAFAEREPAAYGRMNASLSSPRYFALLGELDALIAEPPLTGRAGRPAVKELPRIVTRAWRRLERTYTSAETAPDPVAARHEARKDAKRARYAAEAAIPVLGRPAENVARQAELLQETMGGYQDGVIAQQHLAQAAATADPEEVFTLGVLSGIEHAAAQSALREIPQVWRRACADVHLCDLSRS